MTKAPARGFDLVGAVFAAAAVGLWLGTDAVAWALAGVLPDVGFPLLSVMVRGAALVLLVAGLFRLRTSLAAAGRRLLEALDAAEARLEALPKARGKAVRALVTALVMGGLAAAFGSSGFGAFLETRAIDLFFRTRYPEHSQVELATGRARPSAQVQDDFIIIALDDQTISHLGWPMPRLHYARLIDALTGSTPASVTFDVSKIPSQRMNSGIQAIDGIARNAWSVGSSSRLVKSEYPVIAPRTVPATTPRPKPAATRAKVAS